MTTPRDMGFPWSGDYFGPTLRGHLHALGVVALNYNSLEISFYNLFSNFIGHNDFTANLFSSLRNNLRLEALRASVVGQEKDHAVIDAVGYFAGSFNICSLNRNILMHSVSGLVDNGDTQLKLLKSARNDPHKFTHLRFDVPTLRQAADEIWSLDYYAVDLYFYLQTRSGAMPADDEYARTTLPDKPAPPKNLSLLLDPSAQGRTAQPGSSQA
jgi:hypothetical protein